MRFGRRHKQLTLHEKLDIILERQENSKIFLDHIHNHLERLGRGLQQIMASQQDFADAFSQLNEATNEVSARIDRLIAQIETGGLSSAEESGVLDQLRAASASLAAMGQDPANPNPVELPPEQ